MVDVYLYVFNDSGSIYSLLEHAELQHDSNIQAREIKFLRNDRNISVN
jgi:hypothetical protein